MIKSCCLLNVTIAGAADKRSITATFSVTPSGEFLAIQLIHGGKTAQFATL